MTWLPFDLHPEIPDAGTTVEEMFGPRYTGDVRRAHGERLAAAMAEANLPYRPVRHIPRTRLALEASELVRLHHPEAFDAMHRGLFTAYWADGRDIGDPAVVLEIAVAAGAPAGEVEAAMRERSMREAVDRSTRAGQEAGLSGTPAWLVDEAWMIPGAQPRELFDRVLTKMLGRES